MVLMKRFLDKMGIEKYLREELELPKQNSNRGYSPIQLIINFWVGIWCGASKFEHLEVTRFDGIIKEIFGWKVMAGNKSFLRYFKKFSSSINHQLFTKLFQWFFTNIKFDKYTLDLDSSVFTRYGDQEGAEKGYNREKPGRKSHHPLIGFLSECKMICNIWLRSGSSYTTNNVFYFIEDTLERLKGKIVGLIRADSGFFDEKILEYLEEEDRAIDYIIAGKFYAPIKREIINQKTWWSIKDGIEVSEVMYKCQNWKKSRRIVIVRQSIKKNSKATGKELRLFPDELFTAKYRYSCFVTNITKLSAAIIWQTYKNRADSENRIKEIKYDFGADSFNMYEFYGTDAALNFVIMAYNIMSLFKQTVIQSDVFNRMSTLRYTTFGIGGYTTKNGSQKILKLSLEMNRRKWFKGLWAQSSDVVFPFVVA